MSKPFITITISSASGPPLLGVDDEGAVEAAGDVGGERRDVAVVEVQAEGLGVELVGEALAGLDLAAAAVLADPRHAVHQRRVDAVEVHRVRVVGGVDEADPQPLALAGPQGRAGDAAVVGPGLVLDPGRDFDLLVLGDDRPFAQDAAAGQAPRLAVVEVAQDLGRVEAVGAVVDVRGPAAKVAWVKSLVAGVAARCRRRRAARALSAPRRHGVETGRRARRRRRRAAAAPPSSLRRLMPFSLIADHHRGRF